MSICTQLVRSPLSPLLLAMALVLHGGGAGADGAPAGTPPDLSGLSSVIAALPEGEWAQVSLNAYSDVWTPTNLRPLVGGQPPTPDLIIRPWSGFAWDPNRGELLLYGGGHANYSGNDVYRWLGATRRWERASLPSEITPVDLPSWSGNWSAVDGPDAAPPAAHTYDNNIFFPHIDRFVTFGGGAFNSGGPYIRKTSPTSWQRTGPYFFDPAKANANKVGGTTGSHVKRVSPHPEIIGGNMWLNRDMFSHRTTAPLYGYYPGDFMNGCTAYAEEAGKDVAYLVAAGSGGGSDKNLYRYTVNDLASPDKDSLDMVGIFWRGTGDQTACGYDPTRKILVRIGENAFPFTYWDASTPTGTTGWNNQDWRIIPTDPTGEFATLMATYSIRINDCGFDFDPVRKRFVLWCGGGRVWALTPPASIFPNSGGWTINKQPTPTRAVPPAGIGFSGILGKWKYIDNLDAFMALEDSVQGNIWVYKPVGWKTPQSSGNKPPAGPVAPAAPTGVSSSSKSSVTVAWSASANASSYTIYRSTTSGVQGVSIGISTTASFTDNTPTPGVTYYYSVSANGSGGLSAVSPQTRAP